MTEMEWREKFAQKIFDKMQYLGLNQSELSKLSHISESALNKYLAKERTPKADAIINLAKALQCSVSELIQFGEMIFRNKR